jgi:Asp-tRNA(Asn)/Glu-tRNA(Gln) amidotransferase A subunit family amidase
MRFTAPFNLTGLPAISIPCGFVEQDGNAYRWACKWSPKPDEKRLLRAAFAFENL